MNIKAKLRAGLGLLFAIILALGALSAFYIHELSSASKMVLKDNYETLEYSRVMLRELDESPISTDALLKRFDQQLLKQENNITEQGEATLTANLRYHFEQLKISDDSLNINIHKQEIRNSLNKIMDLNLKAIIEKNEIANKTAASANFFLVFWGAICLLITFSFIVNFPSYIANPIKSLTQGIKEIAAKNYNKRLNFTSKDEFGELAQAFNSMAQKLNDFENSNLAKILFEKKRIETIINSMNDGVFGIDENQMILFSNPVALNFMGLKEGDLLGKYAPDVAMKNDLLRNLLTKPEEKELKIFANGQENYFHKEVVEIFVPDNDGNTEKAFITASKSVGKVFILKNITSFHDLDEAKTNFIATISHELKTPISSIKMSLKLLNDVRVGDLNEEQVSLINHIKDDAERLLKITSELLDVTQLETGKIQLSCMEADPVKILDYAVNSIRLQSEQKSVHLELHAKPDLPKVYADIEKSTWVLINFLSNALRYSTENSKVIIEVKQVKNKVEFSVTDFGKGIEKQYQNKLFDRYFQVPADGENKSGSGLGLTISKDFIEAQQGEIFVESEIGIGSRFGFRLPVHKQAY